MPGEERLNHPWCTPVAPGFEVLLGPVHTNPNKIGKRSDSSGLNFRPKGIFGHRKQNCFQCGW